jgi:hypothetical protein
VTGDKPSNADLAALYPDPDDQVLAHLVVTLGTAYDTFVAQRGFTPGTLYGATYTGSNTGHPLQDYLAWYLVEHWGFSGNPGDPPDMRARQVEALRQQVASRLHQPGSDNVLTPWFCKLPRLSRALDPVGSYNLC